MKNNYREFLYLAKKDYDKSLRINDEDLAVYSRKKLEELHPEKDFRILGETFEKKKRDREKDIGRIELNEARLNVVESGTYNKLFKKQDAFAAVSDGGYIALLQTRILTFVLIALLALAIAGGIWYSTTFRLKPTTSDIYTISGTVAKAGSPLEGINLSLQSGNKEIATAVTDKNGYYLINDVKNGSYNLVCTYGDSVLTKITEVYSASIVVDFTFPQDDLSDVEEITGYHQSDLPAVQPSSGDTEVKAVVKITDSKTPAIAVGGLSEEAMLHMIADKEVDLTFMATLLEDERIPSADKTAIEQLSGELEMTYYDFSVLKEIYKNKRLESQEYLTNTKTVLEIAVPFDSSKSVATYAFRYHGSQAVKMEALESKPAGSFKDGTYYVTRDTVYLYTNCFSTYAIGAANTNQEVRGSDTITYSNQATVNLSSGEISLFYKHDADSTNAATVKLYLVGENNNLLIGESGTIYPGQQIESLALKSDVKNQLAVGTYEGLMKIVYADNGEEGVPGTNVDIPLVIAITQ